jgi:hypothetical protein
VHKFTLCYAVVYSSIFNHVSYLQVKKNWMFFADHTDSSSDRVVHEGLALSMNSQSVTENFIIQLLTTSF